MDTWRAPGTRVELFTRALNGLHLNDFIMVWLLFSANKECTPTT